MGGASRPAPRVRVPAGGRRGRAEGWAFRTRLRDKYGGLSLAGLLARPGPDLRGRTGRAAAAAEPAGRFPVSEGRGRVGEGRVG